MFLDKFFRKHAIHNLTTILVLGQIVAFFLIAANPKVVTQFILHPAAVLRGEVWRLFTFAIFPNNFDPLWVIFSLIFFYIAGTNLENYWGVVRYNKFIFFNWLATILISFAFPDTGYTNSFMYGSFMLAFCTTYPNYQIMLFFIIPLKMKYVGYIYAFGFSYAFFAGPWAIKLSILAPLFIYWLFCRKEFNFKQMRRNVKHKVKKSVPQGAFHNCAECSLTEKKDPDMHFRVCSKCGKEFCSEHIKSHNCTDDSQ